MSLEPSSSNLVRENFGDGNLGNLASETFRRRRNFCDASAPCSVLIATRGAANYGKFVAFAVCSWNLLPPRLVRKNFGHGNFGRSIGATQRFDCNAGGRKRSKNDVEFMTFYFAVCSWNLLPPRLVRESFGHGNFSRVWAPRSVLIGTRGGENGAKTMLSS